MAHRHASHPASEFANTGRAPASVAVKTAAPRTPYRLGGVLRWDTGSAPGLRLFRRAVALVTALPFALLPVMQTATAAETTRVAALGQIRIPLEVAPPAFTMVAAGAAASLSHDGAEVNVPPGALAASGTLSIRPLAAREVAKLDPDLINVTRGPRRGYRMEPSQHFTREVTITLPYDRRLMPDGEREGDLGIYWYDTAAKHWTPLRRVQVNAKDQTIIGWTDHFTDFITGVVVVPDHPQVEGFTPTRIADLKAADPGAKINLVEAPQANATGDARLAYPIELPAGRNGHQPQPAIQYDSSRGNGWLGVGWDLAVPSVEIDTRWGVPRYDTGQINGTPLETETYLLNGEQLAPVANRGALVPRNTNNTKSFSLRVEGQFLKIIRHGNSPSTYWWEATAKDGTRYQYGGSSATGVDPQSVLSDPNSTNGNIGRWMLREVIDPNGNNILFSYNVVTTSPNGPEKARQIYLSSINYTGRTGGTELGPYQVTFTRDNVRTDPIVDGRLGFKTVMTDRLTTINVNLTSAANPLIRSYQLAYKTGQFNKSLLTSITQFGQDGSTFHTHSFDYFDEVGNGSFDPNNPPPINAFGPDVAVPGGGTTSGSDLVSGVNGTAFSGEANTSQQGHLYTGITIPGFAFIKEFSGGFKGGTEVGNANLSQILIDLNGDGRLDQVFVTDSGVFWRPNTGSPTAPSFGSPQPVPGLSAINQSSSATLTAGGEVFFGPGSGLFDVSHSRVSEQIYFADVNGDGLPDLVNNGAVLFNRLDANGNPSFSPNSPTPLGAGAATNTAGLITIPPDQQAALQAAFPLVDSLRRWVAPFTGTINITGQIQLQQTGDAAADGVRTAIQLEDSEIFSLTIAPTDTTAKPITGLTGIPVTAGQRLYFRVNSINDGAFDTVSFDPTITYATVNGAAVDPTTLDENGLPLFVTTASADYAYGGRSLPIVAPAAGTATLSGTVTKPNVTTDDVRFTVTQGQPGTTGTVVFSQSILAGNTGTVPFSVSLTLNQGDQLVARIDSDTRISLSGIRFTPTLAYQTIAGTPAPTKPDGTPALTQELLATAQVYTVSTSPNPPTPWIAPGGPVEVTQTVSGPTNFGGRIALAAKSGGVLLAKHIVNLASGSDQLDVVFNLPAGTRVFFTAEATDPNTPASVTIGAPTTTTGTVLPYDIRLDTSNIDPFGGGYRNWWFGDYTATDPAAPIDQTLLRLPTSQTDQAFRNFIGMLPFEVEDRWQARAANNAYVINRQVIAANAFISGALMGSTRLGARSLDFSDASFGGAQGIVKTGSATNTAEQISLTVFGAGTSNGTSSTDIDFFDFNGDGYPDVVAGGSVQATLPNGALDSRRVSLPGGLSQVRQSTVESDNVTLGATTSALRDTADLFGLNIASEQAPYNVGIGTSASHGTTTANWDLIDINGDGLPDLVQPAGGGLTVMLNLGYRFGQVRATVSKGVKRDYVRVVEAYRDDAGKTQHRTVINLGRRDLLAAHLDFDKLRRLLHGDAVASDSVKREDVDALGAWDWGPMLAARALWSELGLDSTLDRLARRDRRDGVRLSDRALVLAANRLAAPGSEHALAQWLESDFVCDRIGRRFVASWRDDAERRASRTPRVRVAARQLQYWYRTLDRLYACKEETEYALFVTLRDLFSLRVDMVFYDLTSTYFEGEGPPDLGAHGHSRDGKPRNRQVLVGLVMVDGWPIAHHVFAGNRRDAKTVGEVLCDLEARFGLKRVVFVGDRGMVTSQNLDDLRGGGHGYIVGRNRRRSGEVFDYIQSATGPWIECGCGITAREKAEPPKTLVQEVVAKQPGVRVFVVHSEERAAFEHAQRVKGMERVRARLMKLERRVAAGRLKAPAKIGAAAARILGDNHGHRYYDWSCTDGAFRFFEHPVHFPREQAYEGKYVIQTEEPDLSARDAVRLYKELSEVERAFANLKDVIDMRPIYHRSDHRVEAHIFVAALAFLIHRAIEKKLKAAALDLSATEALNALKSVRVVNIALGDGSTKRCVTRGSQRAAIVLRALGITDLDPPTPPQPGETVT